MDFLWHEVDEKERKDIQKQAKTIMDGFSKKLSKIDKKMPEPLIEREHGEREEGGEIKKIDKAIMFENASEKNSDFIIAERKRW